MVHVGLQRALGHYGVLFQQCANAVTAAKRQVCLLYCSCLEMHNNQMKCCAYTRHAIDFWSVMLKCLVANHRLHHIYILENLDNGHHHTTTHLLCNIQYQCERDSCKLIEWSEVWLCCILLSCLPPLHCYA